MLDPMIEALLPGFVEESSEIVERVSQQVIELEKVAASGQAFEEMARGLHTLKGSAATLGLDDLSDLAHKMEDAVLPLRGSAAPLPGPVSEALLKSLDVWMARLRATVAKDTLPDLAPWLALLKSMKGGGAPAPGAEAHAPKPTPATEQLAAAVKREEPAATEAGPAPETSTEEGSWRVNTRQVIGLLHEVERLREVRLRLDERRREMERSLQQLERLAGQQKLAAEAADLRTLLLGVRRSLTSDAEEAADIVATMEDGLKAISTMPVRTIVEPLRRAVRDLCRMTGKQAKFSIVGGEVSLDRRVLESLRGPLVHLVRNAVDHGLEMPDVREARGKHREGMLTIRVEQQGNMLFIEVQDDGGGIDLQAIRDAALQRGIASAAEVSAMAPHQVQQLIFRPGFSTKTEATEISGRGVGLDVVRNQIQAVQGQVEVQSTLGQGTRFVLSLPVELGSSPVLVVRCGEHYVGIPMVAVESSRAARAQELRVGRAKVQLEHRDTLLPLQDLGALLGLRQSEVPQEGTPLLILQSQGKRLALSIDEVAGDRELVIRPLPVEVRDLPAYQGAATLARGELVLILRPDWLVSLERRATGEGGVSGSRRVLVVDDSLTARALHRTALEAGGYLVHTASHGRQALEQLKHTAYDVMVCDIGMDEIDGFELTQLVRQRHETDAMPILLVSARDSDADRQRGFGAGADGFLTKKDCVSGRLLSEVASVIARRKGAA